MTSKATLRRVAQLKRAHDEASLALSQGQDTEEWPLLGDAEQDAWDALVDYVEEHDLNYTEWDPRGPEVHYS